LYYISVTNLEVQLPKKIERKNLVKAEEWGKEGGFIKIYSAL